VRVGKWPGEPNNCRRRTGLNGVEGLIIGGESGIMVLAGFLRVSIPLRVKNSREWDWRRAGIRFLPASKQENSTGSTIK
jgi:hypothetical protein